MNRRLAAITSLVLLAASVVLAVVLGVQSFPRGVSVLACLVAALLAAWWALVHRGAARFAAAAGAVVLVVGAVVLVALESPPNGEESLFWSRSSFRGKAARVSGGASSLSKR